ncbi:hypothetical protein BKA81DRAFT_379785 [Phyllosticta paracitricarpa]
MIRPPVRLRHAIIITTLTISSGPGCEERRCHGAAERASGTPFPAHANAPCQAGTAVRHDTLPACMFTSCLLFSAFAMDGEHSPLSQARRATGSRTRLERCLG